MALDRDAPQLVDEEVPTAVGDTSSTARPEEPTRARPTAKHRVSALLKKRLLLVRNYWHLSQCFTYDFVRFARSSSGGKRNLNAVQLEALMSIDSHRIEKGLSLPSTRPGFGRDVVLRLARYSEEHRARDLSRGPSERAASALRAYLHFHDENGLSEPWMDGVRTIAEPHSLTHESHLCGTVTVHRTDVLAAIPADIDRFFSARHSVRQFAPGPVSDVEIDRALTIAIRTPSVCNRQSWRVHDYATPEDITAVLAYQNGNRGFGQDIARLLIVATDLRTFTKPGERYQCWIDGGLFAMSLVYGLQSLGLGTCTLNCSTEWRRDVALRRAAAIPSHEAVIMMIGVGRLRETYRVARSPRRDPSEFHVKH
jgi:nitroreductase